MNDVPGGETPETSTPPEGQPGARAGNETQGAPPAHAAATAPDGGGSQSATKELNEVVSAGELTIAEVADSLPEQGGSYGIEGTRAGLAIGFLLIFAGTIAAVLLIIAISGDHPAKEVAEVLPTLIPAETALLGSAVGFYFGTKDR